MHFVAPSLTLPKYTGQGGKRKPPLGVFLFPLWRVRESHSKGGGKRPLVGVVHLWRSPASATETGSSRTGMRTRREVPCAGALAREQVPPRRATRSCIERSPRWPGNGAAGSKP